MYGYRVHAWGSEPVWGELADPVPGPDEVLIEVEACSVGLDGPQLHERRPRQRPQLLPRVPGHELIGRVTAWAPGADLEPVGSTGRGVFLSRVWRVRCVPRWPRSACSNLGGWVGVHRDGGYAPLAVLPSRNAIPMPDELDPIAATVVPDAVATPVHIASRAGIGDGDRVVVIGAGGGVGIHMVQVARHFGGTVVGFDLADDKLAEIERLGATAVRSDDLDALDASGLFADGAPTVVVDLIGTRATQRWAIDGLAMGGRLIALTTFRDREFEIESRELVFRELSIIGSRYAYRSELATRQNSSCPVRSSP